MRRPIDPPINITTEFGTPDSNALFGYHSGVDYAAAIGTPVYAPASGTVTSAKMEQYDGNMLAIFDGTYTHRLMHNSQFLVGVGQHVSEGQRVALSGNTGLSTGPHVHWDVIRGNKVYAGAFSDFVDPWQVLQSSPAPAPIQEVLQSFQRRVKGDDSANYRDAPNTGANIRDTFPANDVADFKGWVHGENVNGNDIWFVGRYTGGYSWSGGYTDSSTNGLADMNAPAPTPAPPVPPAPVTQYTTRPSIAGLWGVDVSSFQKTIDFGALRGQGIEIVIIKAGHTGPSYGGNATRTDPTLPTFQRDARAAGLAVGYYWYVYFDEDPETEAARFIQSVGPRVDGEPLFADVEEPNGNADWLTKFVTTVERLSSQRCHIYTYANYLQNNSWLYGLLGDRKLWLAHYDIPAGSATGNYIMHQYTSKGVLQGIGSDYVDLNVFMGDRPTFTQLAALIVAPTPQPQPAPADEKDPVPVVQPPAPIPTPDNNPIRPKVKAAGIAGLILTVALGVFTTLYPGDAPSAVDAAPLITAITTIITFTVAYMKRDGLSPK